MTDPTVPRPPYAKPAVPPYVVVCLTLVVLAVIASFVVLAVTESDATEFRGWLNTVLNLGGIVLGGGAVAFSASADRKAGKAAEQTNGGLEARLRTVVRAENEKQTRDEG